MEAFINIKEAREIIEKELIVFDQLTELQFKIANQNFAQGYLNAHEKAKGLVEKIKVSMRPKEYENASDLREDVLYKIAKWEEDS